MINLDGNGRCDFVGYGAALVANNTGTRRGRGRRAISNQGAVRTAAIADNGATLVVKNSSLSVRNGVLPADYVPTVNLDTMESAPWMLAIDGNVRATNLLGNNSVAAYVNSSVTSESWGVLSTDSGSDCTLVAVNSVVGQTGNERLRHLRDRQRDRVPARHPVRRRAATPRSSPAAARPTATATRRPSPRSTPASASA